MRCGVAPDEVRREIATDRSGAANAASHCPSPAAVSARKPTGERLIQWAPPEANRKEGDHDRRPRWSGALHPGQRRTRAPMPLLLTGAVDAGAPPTQAIARKAPAGAVDGGAPADAGHCQKAAARRTR